MSTAILQDLRQFGPAGCELLSYDQAVLYTRKLAKSHYENFTVVSWFLPRRLRDDFRHVYAFCRWADDLGDMTGDPAKSLELLDWWRTELDACYAGDPRHPVFIALGPTIERHDIPRKPFDDLIDAFIQDQTVNRYQTWDQTVDYCTRSADPVGRLVLYLCGHRDDTRQRLSDATCTALQLANFWQDVRRDILERDRVYIPSEIASKNGLDIETLVMAIRADAKPGETTCGCGSAPPSVGISALHEPFTATMRELIDKTDPLFARGRGLWEMVERDIRLDLRLFTLGGEAILKMIRRQGYDTMRRRPSLGKLGKTAIMLRTLLSGLIPSSGQTPTHAALSTQGDP